MKQQMHYEGTYCLARLAGLGKKAARIIAHADTYVDHSVKDEVQNNKGGGMLVPEETAHHFLQAKNLKLVHQRYIWVPFHFLPGCKGKNFYERVMCVKASDNPLAEPMMERCLGTALTVDFGPHLIGVACHVLQDSFSHQGFSGLASPLNHLKGDSVEPLEVQESTRKDLKAAVKKFKKEYGKESKGRKWYLKLIDQFIGNLGEDVTAGLGHAAAYTYPDLPYLKWTYEYETGSLAGKEQVRDNTAEFVESCRFLHDYLTKVAQAAKAKGLDWVDDSLAVNWSSQMEDNIRVMLSVERDKKARAGAWRKAFAQGGLDPRVKGEAIPKYDVDAWKKERDSFQNMNSPGKITDKDAFHFYQAASYLRHYLLRELLPANGLIVV